MKIQKSKINIKLILSIIIFISISSIFIFGYLIYDEVTSAKKSCKEFDGSYKLKNLKHFCDNKVLYKYSDGTWNFDNKINWNDTFP